MKSKRMRWLRPWIVWVLIVVGCATFLLPKIPFYQVWMPYGYDLGGLALVVLYLSFGFLSLGLYGLVMGGLSWSSDSLRSRRAFKIGLASLGLVTGLVWCYLKLMNLMLSL
jgi:hypothetical protein